MDFYPQASPIQVNPFALHTVFGSAHPPGCIRLAAVRAKCLDGVRTLIAVTGSENLRKEIYQLVEIGQYHTRKGGLQNRKRSEM